MIDQTIEIRSCVKTSSFFSCEKHFSSFFRRKKKHSLVKLRIFFYRSRNDLFTCETQLSNFISGVKLSENPKNSGEEILICVKFSENNGVFLQEKKS